jgi:hypothetical protein
MAVVKGPVGDTNLSQRLWRGKDRVRARKKNTDKQGQEEEEPDAAHMTDGRTPVTTYHDGKDQSHQPGLKGNGEILLEESNNPSHGATGNNENVKDELREFLAFKVHGWLLLLLVLFEVEESVKDKSFECACQGSIDERAVPDELAAVGLLDLGRSA